MSNIKFDVKNLNLHYGKFHALKDVNMEIPEKQITAFIGPSGCGKSTFLKCLNRMNDLVEGCSITGDVKLDGEDDQCDSKPASVTKGIVGPDTAGIVHYIIQTSQTCDHTSHTGSDVFVPGYVDASRICGIGTFTDRSQMQTGSGMTQNIRCRKRYDHCQIRQESIG